VPAERGARSAERGARSAERGARSAERGAAPKIEALHRAIDWLNKFSNCNINCLNLDLSPIDSNAWLAGFTARSRRR
jgi:hypothetical protein